MGFRMVYASVGQYVNDSDYGNMITANVFISVDCDEISDIPVTHWNLYVNNEFLLEIPIYNELPQTESHRKDIIYDAFMPFEGILETAWIIPVGQDGCESTDDMVNICPIPVDQ